MAHVVPNGIPRFERIPERDFRRSRSWSEHTHTLSTSCDALSSNCSTFQILRALEDHRAASRLLRGVSWRTTSDSRLCMSSTIWETRLRSGASSGNSGMPSMTMVSGLNSRTAESKRERATSGMRVSTEVRRLATRGLVAISEALASASVRIRGSSSFIRDSGSQTDTASTGPSAANALAFCQLRKSPPDIGGQAASTARSMVRREPPVPWGTAVAFSAPGLVVRFTSDCLSVGGTSGPLGRAYIM